MVEVKMVTISKIEYDRLLRSDRWLQCLEEAGVDNWSGMEEAYAIRREWDKEAAE